MARLIYFPQSDERPSPLAAFPIDDDSGDWWAGTQRCFAAVPRAAGVAALALSASLCWGAQQQTDEIVPQPVVVVEEETWSSPILLTSQPWTKAWISDEEIVPAPAIFRPDEDSWFPPPPIQARPWITPATADDEIVPQGVAFRPDEDAWLPPTPQPSQLWLRAWMADDELVPAPVVVRLDEDAWLPPLSAPARSWITAWTVDDDTVPVVFRPDEDAWTVFLARTPSPNAFWPAWLRLEEDIVFAPGGPRFIQLLGFSARIAGLADVLAAQSHADAVQGAAPGLTAVTWAMPVGADNRGAVPGLTDVVGLV